MPQPKACHVACPPYMLMTLLCSLLSPLSYLDYPSVFVGTYILLCSEFTHHIILSLCIPDTIHNSASSSDFFFISALCNIWPLLTLPLMSPLLPFAHPHSCLSSASPFCLLSEGTVRAPAGHRAVVKAARTVTWSAWSHGPGAAQTRTAPTAPSGRPWLRLAVSLASPSLPEGIVLEATKAHRAAAKALALVRTVTHKQNFIF